MAEHTSAPDAQATSNEPTLEDRDDDAVDQPTDLPRHALPGVMVPARMPSLNAGA
jgi:hypothetical protein